MAHYSKISSGIILVSGLLLVTGLPVPIKYTSEDKSSEETMEIEFAPYVSRDFDKKVIKLKLRPMSSSSSLPIASISSRPSSSYFMNPKPIYSRTEATSTTTSMPPSNSMPIIFEEDYPNLHDDELIEIFLRPSPPSSTTESSKNLHKWDKKTTTEPSKFKKVDGTLVERFFAKGINTSNCPKNYMYSKRQRRCIPKPSFADSLILG